MAFGIFVDIRTAFSRVRGLAIAGALCVAAVCAAAPSPGPDVRVVRSTTQELVLEFTPRYAGTDTIHARGTQFLLPHFLSESAPDHQLPGTPDVRCRILTIAVPDLAGNMVEVLTDEGSTVTGTLAPVPSRTRDASGFRSVVSYVADPGAYAASQFPRAALVNPGTVRSLRVATLVLYPVQYNAAARKITAATRMRIRVRFTRSGIQASSGQTLDPALRGVVVNENVASVWADQRAGIPAKRTMTLSGQEWARIAIRTDGMYTITAAQLAAAGFNTTAIDPATLQLFGLGGRELPEAMDSAAVNEMREVAIAVMTDNTGKFDHLLFYGKGPYGWKYAPATKAYSHTLHHYDTLSTYVLTYGAQQGKRITAGGSAGTPTMTPDRFTDRLFREDEDNNGFVIAGHPGSGREWFMATVNPEASSAYQVYLPGYAGGTVSCRVCVGGHSDGDQSFDVFSSDVSLGRVAIPNTFGDAVFSRTRSSLTMPASSIAADGRTTLRFQYHSSTLAGIGAVDWYEVTYQRFFRAIDNTLHFWTADTTAVAEYSLQGFGGAPTVWDVTDDANVVQLPVLGFSGGVATVDLALTQGTPREVIAVSETDGASRTAAVQKIDTWGDVRTNVLNAQYVIITDRSLLDAAARLKAHRSAQLSTLVVATDQIFDEFSGGMRDVTAIRDFLRYAYVRGNGRLRYALLLGDGSYDYKHDAQNLVPAYENNLGDSFDEVNSLATDDFFGYIAGNDTYIDVALGRICVRSPQDADNAVTKIITYDMQSDRSDWRNRATFVADDNFRGSEQGADGTTFTDDAENLIRSEMPATFDVRKIYLAQYTTVYTGMNNTGGRTKPGAYEDIIDAFNTGSLLTDWIGHGNPHVWAHEGVFVNETTIPRLRNLNRLTFLTAATCDFGRFDNPAAQCGTELLQLKADGGTIGVLSTSRAVYDFYNIAVNGEFFQHLLNEVDNGQALRIGDALFRTKQHNFNLTNDQKFYLQGDPAQRLLMPTSPVTVEHANNVDVRSDVATLKALMHVRVDGTVRHRDSAQTLWSDFNGTADVTVYDSERELAVQSGTDTFRFTQPGGMLYRGKSTVTNGQFAASFIVPKDISYENKRGKITVYAVTADGRDAVGATNNITVGGTDTNHVADTRGPAIKLFMDARTFRPGDFVSATPLLIVDLSDSSGINASGTAIGHHIEAWVDDAVNSIDLTAEYRGSLDDPTSGSAERVLTDLTAGTHRIRVRGWDVFNNPAEASTTFVIPTSGTGLIIDNVMPIPNPFASGTTFTLQQNQSGPVDVEIKVYTVAGRLIQSVAQQGIMQHFVTIPWDGKDRDGNQLGNGVYLYRVIVRTTDGAQQSETVGRLAVLR